MLPRTPRLPVEPQDDPEDRGTDLTFRVPTVVDLRLKAVTPGSNPVGHRTQVGDRAPYIGRVAERPEEAVRLAVAAPEVVAMEGHARAVDVTRVCLPGAWAFAAPSS